MPTVSFAPTPALTAGTARAEDPRLLVHEDPTSECLDTALKVAALAACLFVTVATFATFGPVAGLIISIATVPLMVTLFNSLIAGQRGAAVHINSSPVYVPWHQRVISWIPDISWQPMFSPGRGNAPAGGNPTHVPTGRATDTHVRVGRGHDTPAPSRTPSPPPTQWGSPAPTGTHVRKGGGHDTPVPSRNPSPPPTQWGGSAPTGTHLRVGEGHTPPSSNPATGTHVGVGSGRNRTQQ